ncbi:hypothetical protein, partial [Sinorhizobium meliloti]|uniref:hypothetical protein n=1 Tax=Rhizobium meliloti TaxID=382 RepID=UPI001AECF643
SLDNQKIDGKTPSDGACACDISIHPELSPDSPAFYGERVRVRGNLDGKISKAASKLCSRKDWIQSFLVVSR